MSLVMTGASMSLDGYISGPDESGFEHLFAWYERGDVEVKTAEPNLTRRVTEIGAEGASRAHREARSLRKPEWNDPCRD
jgi:hypothetical protein